MTQLSSRDAPVANQGLVRVEDVEAAMELDSFVYIVSHDLRNSARALTEVPTWLRDDLQAQGVSLSDDTCENLELLERHAKRLDRMLLDLLVYSRVGRKQTVTDFEMADVVQDVVNESAPSDRVTVEVLGDLPRLHMGYKDAFVLVKNVLDNVVRHSKGAPVTLRISAQRRASQVTMTLTDDGPGIPTEELQRMFRPMTTGVRRDEVEGSGMGLAIIHRIVAHYGGEIWAGSGPNGIGFRLRVRLRDAVQNLVEDSEIRDVGS